MNYHFKTNVKVEEKQLFLSCEWIVNLYYLDNFIMRSAPTSKHLSKLDIINVHLSLLRLNKAFIEISYGISLEEEIDKLKIKIRLMEE